MGTLKSGLSKSEFIRLFEEVGPSELARRAGVSINAIEQRRKTMEKQIGRAIYPPATNRGGTRIERTVYPHRVELNVQNGTVLIGSDAHIWPGRPSTAMRGFISFIEELKPAAVILNGDMCDFPSISRHDPLGWESWPTVAEEIEAAQECLHNIATAAGQVPKIWTLGNHDARYEKRLAILAPEFVKVNGVHLKDHFPLWEPCWSVWINGDTVIKHRWKGGVHATRNNTLNAGTHTITAHLHSAKVSPVTDYNGTRYGVDNGCLADVDHASFVNYTEDSPKDWRSGFCVLTFHEGRLLQPQLAIVHDKDSLDFCGKVIQI